MPDSPPLHVVAAVMIHDGKILGCRRASHKDAAGQWEFPGGKVESGESPRDALKREISEELSLTVSPWRLLDKSVTQVNEALAIQLECWVIILDQVPVLKSSDHDEFVWLEPEELSRFAWAKPDLPAVKMLGAHRDLETLWPMLSDPGPNLNSRGT